MSLGWFKRNGKTERRDFCDEKISIVLLLIVVIFVPNQSFAGDIPEWLLQDEDTQIFIGEVKEMGFFNLIDITFSCPCHRSIFYFFSA